MTGARKNPFLRLLETDELGPPIFGSLYKKLDSTLCSDVGRQGVSI
jgi:hypothetical protein